MRSFIRRIGTRLVIANLLVLPVLILLISFTSSNAAAADVSGTWTSSIDGKGYMQTSHILDTNYDVKLVLTQSGDEVSGTITTTVTYALLHTGYESWGKPSIGQQNTNTVSGTMSGSTLILTCYSPATSGTSGGVSYTTDASTTTWTLNLNGTDLTGSGTYVGAGITYGYRFYLEAGDSSELSGFSGQVTAPVIFGMVGGLACLVVSFIPAPKGKIPSGPGQTGSAYSYQPSDVRTTGGASGAPTDPTYLGGAGLTYPQNYVNGTPVRPGRWQGQQGPVCPIHGTVCQAHLISVNDPGSWFCPKCAEQGRASGYPWGRQ
jgi:hypothetical protein